MTEEDHEAYNKRLLQENIDQHNKIGFLSRKVYDLQKENMQIEKIEQEKWTLKTNLEESICIEESYKKKVEELKAQIDKMKCCSNCVYQGECDLSGYEECKNFDKWELRR